MKQSINLSQFQDAFKSIRPDNFSYDGLEALYDYLEDYEDGTGEEVELDVIAICCEFSEYTSAQEAAEDHGFTAEPFECPECYEETSLFLKHCEHCEEEIDASAYDEETQEATLEYLQDRTTVITFDSGVIIQTY
jgi:hypothetical protein